MPICLTDLMVSLYDIVNHNNYGNLHLFITSQFLKPFSIHYLIRSSQQTWEDRFARRDGPLAEDIIFMSTQLQETWRLRRDRDTRWQASCIHMDWRWSLLPDPLIPRWEWLALTLLYEHHSSPAKSFCWTKGSVPDLSPFWPGHRPWEYPCLIHIILNIHFIIH